MYIASSERNIMSKIACTVLLDRDTSPLSPHFGKAKWVMISDPETGATEFEQNHGLNGRAIVDILVRHQCTDAIFAEIGPGALAHLRQGRINAWFAPQNVPASEIIQKFRRGELTRALAPSPGHGGHHGSSAEPHGCCGSSVSRVTQIGGCNKSGAL
jgi:predicted Fe-Mo cluster-binding NifX family protein